MIRRVFDCITRQKEDSDGYNSVTNTDGSIERYLDGKLHCKEWYSDGELHREDGPAVEHADGSTAWYRRGKLHREDGPAIEHANGTRWWYRDDRLHREDGPAVEHADGSKYWYRNGERAAPASFGQIAILIPQRGSRPRVG